MKYATGEQPQVGDRVTFIRVNGQPQEGVVTKLGITGLFARIVFPSTSWLSKDGMGFVSGIVPMVSLVDRGCHRIPPAEHPSQTSRVMTATDQIVQEVSVKLIGPEGSRREVVMNMGPGVNTVILSGKVDSDTDLQEGTTLFLQAFPGMVVQVEALDPDIDWGDEVLVTGHLEPALGAVTGNEGKTIVVADQVVKLG